MKAKNLPAIRRGTLRAGLKRQLLLQGSLTIATSIIILLFSLAHFSYTHADPLPTVDESGTLGSSETWVSGNVYVIDSEVTVPSGVTLTIDAGAIVKIPGSTGTGISVASGGTLDITGSSEDPVIFTSYNDDSAGGDTNDDGASSGAVGDYYTAIDSEAGGTVDVSHATIKYADLAVRQLCTDGSSTTLTDNTFNSAVFAQYCTEGQLSLERNNFDVSLDGSDAPLEIGSSDVSGVILSGTNKNTFSGSGQQLAVQLFATDTIASDATWTVDNTSGAVLVGDNLTVSGTLNLDTGVVFKAATISGSSGTDISVASGGTLNVTGTSEDPVIFTSDKDDSVGGDTNGDGSSSGAVGDYGVAIDSEAGGTVDVSHATIKYADLALKQLCTDGSSTTFTDSTFNSAVFAQYCSEGQLSLERNNFDVSLDGSDAPLAIGGSDITGVILSGTNKNTFSGSGQQLAVQLFGTDTIASDATWTVDNTSGAILIGDNLTVLGTLNLNTGAILKTATTSGASGTGISVASGGTLNVSGTSENPVIFTSDKDDSVGGDTNGDGSSSGAVYDYGTAVVSEAGGTVDASHVTIKDAGYAAMISGGGSSDFESTDVTDTGVGLSVSGTSETYVTYRGSFSNISEKAIEACNWGVDNCAVDAAYTHWGSDDGPFPSSGDLVCGQVTVNPWKTTSSTASNDDMFAANNCDSSTKTSTALSASASAFGDEIGTLTGECDEEIEDACTLLSSEMECLNTLYDTARESEDVSFEIPDFTLTVADGVLDAAYNYVADSEFETGSGDVATTLHHAVNFVVELNNAYNTCLGS